MSGKPLADLLRLLRKHGVEEYRAGDVAIRFGEAPRQLARGAKATPDEPDEEEDLTGHPSGHLQAFYKKRRELEAGKAPRRPQ